VALPPGTTVLSFSGTDRQELRASVAVLTLGVFAAGFFFGYQMRGRRRRW